jgi:hypothetical protein
MFSQQLWQLIIQVRVSHVEVTLTFFQVQVERLRGNPMKLLQAMFSKAPEALNAVDMMRASGKFILSIAHSIVFQVATSTRPYRMM